MHKINREFVLVRVSLLGGILPLLGVPGEEAVIMVAFIIDEIALPAGR
jgi:hypothetical protein